MRKKSNSNFVAEQPRQGWAYFEETNQWRRTPYPWGAPGDHFPREYGDWVAVSKPQGWQPPTGAKGGTLAGESLLGAGGASLLLFAPEEAAGAGGGHTKIGAGHKPQPYGEHGWYTGPRGGSIPMDGGPVRLYADDADKEPGGEESPSEDAGAEPEEATEEIAQELEGVLVADSGRVMSDAGGGLSGGTEVRGPVTPPAQTGKVIPPPPPAPKEPHLIYSQSTGEMTGPDGKNVATGYAGRGGGQNNPDAEGIKGVGPLPQGNWRMEKVDTNKWPDPSYKLSPDEETRKRVEALDRDPDSFYIHAKARDPKDQGRDSWGCIALDKGDRDKMKSYDKRWIRVER